MTSEHETIHPSTDPRLSGHIDSACLGAIFIWAGFTLLVGGGWGMALMGVGVIVLGEQLVRRRLDVEFSQSWAVVGIALILGGLVIVLDILGALVPIALMAAGVVLVVTALVRARSRA
ncbi:hypothetical protein GF314_03850 [bacterium]|nr:hypothetical protein [bacterium]